MTMEEKDRQAIQEYVDHEWRGCGVWFVFRRGSPGRPIHVVRSGMSTTIAPARERFERIRLKMRQGSLYLVDPEGKIIDHQTEPMVRTRW